MSSNRHHAFPVLIGDIGGTNARFQIVPDDTTAPLAFEPILTADFPDIQSAFEQSVLNSCDVSPRSAIIAAAGPITKDGLNLTNSHWDIKPGDFLQSGGIEHLILMNDFEAQALSLPFLDENDLAPLGNSPSKNLQERTKAVLGPGTGLGVGLLVRAGGKWIPVAGEGGHVDLGPRSDREREIWDHLETEEGRISGEQVVCGDGLINLYNACCKADNKTADLKEAKAISAAAMSSKDQHAVEALSLFCTTLGRVAGDLALTSMAKGGVYVAGGIAQKILPFLEASSFRSAFDDKAPHGDLMKSIATNVVTYPLPALLGLAAYARDPDAFAVDVTDRSWVL